MEVVSPKAMFYENTPAIDNRKLREAQKSFESVLISEFIKHLQTPEFDKGYIGGIGEQQFRSLLINEYAKVIAESGSMNVFGNVARGQ